MRAKKIITFATSSLLLCAAPLVYAQSVANPQGSTVTAAQRGQLSENDYRFLEKAARGGMEEVELGQLAEKKAASPAVRQFGERMVTDHGKLNNQLKQLASQKGATVPTSLSHHENSTVEHLQNENGVKFDQSYAKDMVKDHKHDIKEFQSAAKSVQDPDLRAFVQSAVPILQDHLNMAENMENSVKSEK